MVDQGQANNNYHLAKRVLFALSTHASTERQNRYIFEQMDDMIRANRQRSALRALYQATINKKIISLVFEQVNLRTNRRLAAEYLQQMRNLS